MEDFIPFALPDIGEAEIAEVVECLRSGWLTTGPKTRQFEEDFARYLGGGVEAITTNSATAGLHLALEALGVGPGHEVVVPTLTFTATAEVVRYLGADPVFVDVDAATLNVDVDAIAAAITPRSKVLMPVHYAGLPCEMDAILALARRRGLKVVEDAAHACTARHRGRLIGTLESDAAVFSFYATKTLATGEGGMVATRDAELARRVRVMRLHGISRDAFDRYTSRTPAWYYEVVAPGFKYNLTDIASALGIQQLRRAESMLARRRHLAQRYSEELRDLPLVLPADAAGGSVHAWHLYVVRLRADAPRSRDDLIQRLSERRIATSVHYVPLHRQPYWRDTYQLTPERFPVADAAYRAMVSLPLYSRMSDGDQTRVIEALRDLLC